MPLRNSFIKCFLQCFLQDRVRSELLEHVLCSESDSVLSTGSLLAFDFLLSSVEANCKASRVAFSQTALKPSASSLLQVSMPTASLACAQAFWPLTDFLSHHTVSCAGPWLPLSGLASTSPIIMPSIVFLPVVPRKIVPPLYPALGAVLPLWDSLRLLHRPHYTQTEAGSTV